MNQHSSTNVSKAIKSATKILFAAFPGDGHFNPLTGLAAQLKSQGYDVAFYTAVAYKEKVERLGIPFFPFIRARELDVNKMDEIFPDRKNHKGSIARLNHDIINVFIKQGPEYYADLQQVRKQFHFDLLIADVLFTGIPFVKDLMKVPVLGVGVIPITSNSRDLPPSGMAATPSYSILGKTKQNMMRWMAKHVLFAKSNKVMKEVFGGYGIEISADNVFDLMPKKCNLLLQTGTPGFEYLRSDMPENIRFMGPLLPYSKPKANTQPWYDQRLTSYDKVILVTQGTVEQDSTKLLVPALEGLKDRNCLVIVATGGGDTEKLRSQYTAPNVIIEDFIPFADVMPYADAYITNGGMGGVQLGVQNGLPMVVAGVHEGKNEICARVGYFKLGINLKTERPTPEQIHKAVEEVTSKEVYRSNVAALRQEFARYDANTLCEQYVREVLPQPKTQPKQKQEVYIY